MSSSSTPATPARPPRSLHRLTIISTASSPLLSPVAADPLQTPSFAPSSWNSPVTDSTPTTPRTPGTPTHPDVARPLLNNRRSASSVRRKPVPVSIGDELDRSELAEMQGGQSPWEAVSTRSPFDERRKSVSTLSISTLSTPASLRSEPPRYVLAVDVPLPTSPAQYPTSTPLPSYTLPSASSATLVPSQFDIDTSFGARSAEDLPGYAVKTETEPKTLAKALWKWGFLFPLLWLIGMCIMWIPLRPIEEERDPEKAQKLEEMIVILRKAELKYAKRCAIAFCSFVAIIIFIVVIAAEVIAKTK